jgi:hypothetical protein
VRAIVLHNPTTGSGDVSAEHLLAALAAGGIASRYAPPSNRTLRMRLESRQTWSWRRAATERF